MHARDLLVHAGVVGLLAAAGVVATTTASSLAGSPAGARSVFVPTTPCRLADTRAGVENVGARSAPLQATETHTFQVWGPNGNCDIPTDATAIATNVTAVNPTSASYLTVFPADAQRPVTSNLNWTPSSPPTPNQVTVGLSAAGAVAAYNNAGTIDVIIDVVGWFETAPTGGAQGPAGPVGPPGPQGPAGVGALAEGETVLGAFEYRFPVATANSSFTESIMLPWGKSWPDGYDFNPDNSAVTVDEDPLCTGSFQAPSAPPGWVCLYLDAAGTMNVANAGGGNGGYTSLTLSWTAPQAGSTHLKGKWAYTYSG